MTEEDEVQKVQQALMNLSNNENFKKSHAILMGALISCAGEASLISGLSVPAIMCFLACEVALVPIAMNENLKEDLLEAIKSAINNESSVKDMGDYMNELSLAMIRVHLGLDPLTGAPDESDPSPNTPSNEDLN